MSDNWHAQLSQLRDLTDKTGVLHEAQIVQLKYWPYLAFATPKAGQIEVAWDPGEHDGQGWIEAPTVHVKIDADLAAEPADLRERIVQVLYQSVRRYICSVAALQVECRGVKVWDSREDFNE